jgi:hypothetical protein
VIEVEFNKLNLIKRSDGGCIDLNENEHECAYVELRSQNPF